MKCFNPSPQRVGEAVKAQWHDHELLHIDRVVGVLATIDDVHHRRRQDVRGRATQVAIQWQLTVAGRRLGNRHGGAQDGVGPQPLLVGRAVQFDHHLIDCTLLQRVQTDQRVSDLAIDVFDRLGHSLAEVDRSIAIAQFPRLVSPRAGSAGYGRPTEGSIHQFHLNLDGGLPRLSSICLADSLNDAHRFARLREFT